MASLKLPHPALLKPVCDSGPSLAGMAPSSGSRLSHADAGGMPPRRAGASFSAAAASSEAETAGAAVPPTRTAVLKAQTDELQRRLLACADLLPARWGVLKHWIRLVRRLLGNIAKEPALLSQHPSLLLGIATLLHTGGPLLMQLATLCIQSHRPGPQWPRPHSARMCPDGARLSHAATAAAPQQAGSGAPPAAGDPAALPPWVVPGAMWDAACCTLRLLEHCVLAVQDIQGAAPSPPRHVDVAAGGADVSSSGGCTAATPNAHAPMEHGCAESSMRCPALAELQQTLPEACVPLLCNSLALNCFALVSACIDHQFTAADSKQPAAAGVPSLRAITLMCIRLATVTTACLQSSKGAPLGEGPYVVLVFNSDCWKLIQKQTILVSGMADLQNGKRAISQLSATLGAQGRGGDGRSRAGGGAQARLQARLQQRSRQQPCPTEADMHALVCATGHLATTLYHLNGPMIPVTCKGMPARVRHVTSVITMTLDGLATLQQPNMWADPGACLDTRTALLARHPYRDGPGALISGALGLLACLMNGEGAPPPPPEHLAGLTRKVWHLMQALLPLLEQLGTELDRWAGLCGSGCSGAITPHVIRSVLTFLDALASNNWAMSIEQWQDHAVGHSRLTVLLWQQTDRLSGLLPSLATHPQRALWAADLVRMAAAVMSWQAPCPRANLKLMSTQLALHRSALELLCDPEVMPQRRDARLLPWISGSKSLIPAALLRLVTAVRCCLRFSTTQAGAMAAELCCLAQQAVQWAAQWHRQLHAVAVLVGIEAAALMRADVGMLEGLMLMAAVAAAEAAAQASPAGPEAHSMHMPVMGSVQLEGPAAERSSVGVAASAAAMARASLQVPPVTAPRPGPPTLSSLLQHSPGALAQHASALHRWLGSQPLSWLHDLHARVSAAAAGLPQPSDGQVQAVLADMRLAVAHACP